MWAWGFGCWWIANSAAVVVNDWLPGRFGIYQCAFLLVTIAFWVVGLRLRQFRTLFDVDQLQSLFNDQTKHRGM